MLCTVSVEYNNKYVAYRKRAPPYCRTCQGHFTPDGPPSAVLDAVHLLIAALAKGISPHPVYSVHVNLEAAVRSDLII